jgi:hypothetical protein
MGYGIGVAAEPSIAFAAPPENGGPFEIRVNFGVFAGREATAAELDALAQRLVPFVGTVSIVSEERREVGAGAEAVLHLVRIELDRERLPADPGAMERLEEELVATADEWARSCDAERHASGSAI